MKQDLDTAQLMEQALCPAFTVTDGIITDANLPALQRQLTPGTEILPLLCCGQQEYKEFTSGRLCLTMIVKSITYSASVIRKQDHDLFYLESGYINPELRAFAAASCGLRDPLSNAMVLAETLSEAIQTLSPEQQAQFYSLKRSLHQVHRTVCNMSDASQNRTGILIKEESRDICAVVSEIVEKARDLLHKGGYTLEYTPCRKVFYRQVNRDILERAILNLISNSFKYGAKDSPVQASLSCSGGAVRFCVSNRTENAVTGNLFTGYLWEPLTKGGNAGLGLGITIARNAATAHGGTLLMDQPEADTVRFTLTIPSAGPNSYQLHSHVTYPIDYSGGYDHVLTELSELLPPEMFV